VPARIRTHTHTHTGYKTGRVVVAAPFFTYVDEPRRMKPIPRAALLDTQGRSHGEKILLTLNPIEEDLDTALPYPAPLADANATTDVDVLGADNIPILLEDMQELCPIQTVQEAKDQVFGG
jgi:hypothetical protein